MSLLPLSALKKSLQVYKEMNSGLNFEDVNVDLTVAQNSLDLPIFGILLQQAR